jgi:hypothetical protein
VRDVFPVVVESPKSMLPTAPFVRIQPATSGLTPAGLHPIRQESRSRENGMLYGTIGGALRSLKYRKSRLEPDDAP